MVWRVRVIKKKRTIAATRSSLCKHFKVPNFFHCTGSKILHLFNWSGKAQNWGNNFSCSLNFMSTQVSRSSVYHVCPAFGISMVTNTCSICCILSEWEAVSIPLKAECLQSKCPWKIPGLSPHNNAAVYVCIPWKLPVIETVNIIIMSVHTIHLFVTCCLTAFWVGCLLLHVSIATVHSGSLS